MIGHRTLFAAVAAGAAALSWVSPHVAAQLLLPPERPFIFCYDSSRDAVNVLLAAECRGEIVTAETARDISERRDRRVLDSIERRPAPNTRNRRLAAVGTGFFISLDGFILTNHHVVAECSMVTAESDSGQAALTRIVAIDREHDLALLETGLIPRDAATFRAGPEPAPGTRIAIVGFPDMGLPTIQPQVASGDLLASAPPDVKDDAPGRLALRVDVRGGNSGGPVLDDRGQVIGVISSKLNTVKVYQATGQLIRDIGFAISNSTVLPFLDHNNTAYTLGSDHIPVGKRGHADNASAYIARLSCWQ
jgi:serine protease Do